MSKANIDCEFCGLTNQQRDNWFRYSRPCHLQRPCRPRRLRRPCRHANILPLSPQTLSSYSGLPTKMPTPSRCSATPRRPMSPSAHTCREPCMHNALAAACQWTLKSAPTSTSEHVAPSTHGLPSHQPCRSSRPTHLARPRCPHPHHDEA